MKTCMYLSIRQIFIVVPHSSYLDPLIAAHGCLRSPDYVTGVPRGEKALGYVSALFIIYPMFSFNSVRSPCASVKEMFSLCVPQVNIFNGKNMASAVNFTGLQVRTVHILYRK